MSLPPGFPRFKDAKPRPKKAQREQARYWIVRRAVLARADGRCEAKFARLCRNLAEQTHHVTPRSAGARGGQADERWLWPEVVRCLRVLRPRYALMENVPGLVTLGFADVATHLAELGYDFEWDCIPAQAVGAPHLRYRIFVVAHAASDLRGTPRDARPETSDRRSPVADTDTIGRDVWTGIFGPAGRRQLANCREWAVEPDVGRVAHGIPHRVDRLRALGNAVVPQVAEWIGRQLLEAVA